MEGTKFVEVESAGALKFIRPSALATEGITGVVLEGVYAGSQANQLNPDKLDYAFETGEGEKTIINGTASLARQMLQVNEGELVQIEYLGKVNTKNGKTAHNFIVRTAKEA